MTTKHHKNQQNSSNFSERLLKLALQIPEGKVTTYGDLVQKAGGVPAQSRFVTSILSKANKENKYKIPYHRIVYSNGKVWIDPDFRAERLRIYKKEGIKLDKNDKIIDFDKIRI
jgi:methylated-DNA-protein-cysteine methyltransferase-like protein